MVIQQRTEGSKSSFYIEVEGTQIAEIVYSETSHAELILEHTEVNKEYRGKNVGQDLVMKTVEYARENNFKIIPICVFAKAVFDKKQDIHDVLS